MLSSIESKMGSDVVPPDALPCTPSPPLLPAGYTPLHMASGYMHTGPMAALLEAGADPLIKDKQGVHLCVLGFVCVEKEQIINVNLRAAWAAHCC